MIEFDRLVIAFVGFSITFLASLLIAKTNLYQSERVLDNVEGIQKFHSAPTPRIGGIALAFGFFVILLFLDGEDKYLFGWIGLSSLPVLAFGLAEDIYKNAGVGVRLAASLLAGVIFSLTTGYTVERVYLWWFDILLSIPVLSIAFTAFAIGSATNAINIIDGFHGLASGSLLFMFAAVGVVTFSAGDYALAYFSLFCFSVTVGFFLVNFPFGKIFLGDGGAYFLGFVLSVLTVMIPSRNPEITPWICPLILSYPLTELIVSISRKILRKGHHPGRPDNLHLHMLIYRLIASRSQPAAHIEAKNHALTSFVLWGFPAASLILVLISDLDQNFAQKSIVAIFCSYLIVYNVALVFDKKLENQ